MARTYTFTNMEIGRLTFLKPPDVNIQVTKETKEEKPRAGPATQLSYHRYPAPLGEKNASKLPWRRTWHARARPRDVDAARDD
jgi:hypothetical protein